MQGEVHKYGYNNGLKYDYFNVGKHVNLEPGSVLGIMLLSLRKLGCKKDMTGSLTGQGFTFQT